MIVAQADLKPKSIHIKLDDGFWLGAILDIPRTEITTIEAMRAKNRDQFELFDVTFHNGRGLPDWMK